MVLIDSHTISRNIAYDAFDDIVDSLSSFEDRRVVRPRHERFHHSYRRQEIEESKTARPKENKGVKDKAASLVGDSPFPKVNSTTAKLVTTTTSAKPGFWHKFRNKLGHKKGASVRAQNGLHKRRVGRKKYRKIQNIPGQSENDFNNAYFKFDSSRRKTNSSSRKRYTYMDKRKRDVSSTNAATLAITAKYLNTRSFFSSHRTTKRGTTFNFSKIKTYMPASTHPELTTTLGEMTTVNKLSNLKQDNDIHKSNTSPISVFPTKYKESPISSFSSKYKDMLKNLATITPAIDFSKTTDDVDFIGTAQIEALLNDIKVKAVQMVADQNPGITDIVTNTVTETTFEVDPLLTHMSINTPGYDLGTVIPIDSSHNKRVAEIDNAPPSFNDTVVITNTEPTHQIHGRSISEDVYTISQTIEDALQKNLKKFIHKVQRKLSTQCQKEVKEAKSTIKKKVETDKHSPTAVTKPMNVPKNKNKHKGTATIKQRRTPKPNKIGQTIPTSTESPLDDYIMLTLLEQLLAKTHEDNVMKMLTTTQAYHGRYLRMAKRSPESSTAKLYEDLSPIDLDYESKTEDSTSNPDSYSTESGAEDTSYEGLSNKICYNDYVNGYRHYLKFQKEQGSQNFSNLVKYQAHRHHNVDDIGKFILDKIPQLSTKRRKRDKLFEEEDVLEDQDISTKSDESWFKKHFYLFIDNGPPKKFHTSQTVELKSPITEGNYDSNDEVSGAEESIETSLEALSKSLDIQKAKQFSHVAPEHVSSTTQKKVESGESKNSNSDSLFKGFGAIKFVDKLFGKDRTPKTYRDEDTEMEREKRNLKGHVDEAKLMSIDNPVKSTMRSTFHNHNGYVDVNLIPKPTAIVKLRENKEKKGKLKKFFNKFRFHKRKKTKEVKKHDRTKRQNRVQRFNPLKKLQDMFRGKTPTKAAKENYDIQDYDMMTSHIDTFKPVKYNKVPTLDEIKGQIPNISEEHHNENMKHSQLVSVEQSKPSAKPDLQMSFEYPLMTEMFEATMTPMVKETTCRLDMSSFHKSTPKKFPLPDPSLKKTTSIKPFEETSTPFATEYTFDSTADELVKKYDSNRYSASSPSQSSVDDIRNEINGLQKKLSMYPTTTERLQPESTTRFHQYPVSSMRMYIPPHIQAMSLQPSKTENSTALTIQTQLTRIAKFPLSQFHHSKSEPIVGTSQYFNQKTNVHKRTIDKPTRKVRKHLNTLLKGTRKYARSVGYNDYFKPYPDYFNDLLIAHGDLLNADKITIPRWENVLDSANNAFEYTTLSMMDMQRELMHINDFLANDDDASNNPGSTSKAGKRGRLPKKIKKNKIYMTNTKPTNEEIIKTVAIKDNAMAKTNDLIIQSEAKVFHVMKQPDFKPEKYIQATDLINHINKLYHEPTTKYDKEKLRDSKRNDQFWKIVTGDKNKNTQDQEESSSLLYLDTTLLSYDDGPDFLMVRPKHKKMSKTSAKPSKLASSATSPKPIAKTNPSPVQYFSTPVPMKMNDFEKFLKENRLDVQSVTKPLLELPNLLNSVKSQSESIKNLKLESKITNQKSTEYKNLDKIPTTVSDESKKMIDDAIRGVIFTANPYTSKEIKEQATWKNFIKTASDRRKRYSELFNDRFFTFEPFRKKKKIGKLNKKIKFFDKKPKPTPRMTGAYTVDEPINRNSSDIQNEVELTIIDMDDLQQNVPNKKNTHSSELKYKAKSEMAKPHTLKQTAISTVLAKTRSTAETSETPLEKDLLFPYHHTERTKMDSITTVQLKNAKDKVITDGFQTTTFRSLIDQQLFSKLHGNKQPKRVKISSHNYKYDIIYSHEPERWRKKSVRNYKNNRIMKHKFGSNNDDYSPSYNSDFADSNEPGIGMRRTAKKRIGRQATYLPDPMAPETMNKIEKAVPNWREKRRLKLFTNIKEKLMTLLRKPQSTTAAAVTTIEEVQKTTANPTVKELQMNGERTDETKGFEAKGGIETTDYGYYFNKINDKPSASGGDKKMQKGLEVKNDQKAQTDAESLMRAEELLDHKSLTVPRVNNTTKATEDILKANKLTSEVSATTTTGLPTASTSEDPLKVKQSEKLDPLKGDRTTATAKAKALTTTKHPETTKHRTHLSNEEVYFEPLLNQKEQICYEHTINTPSTKKTTIKPSKSPKPTTKSSETKLEKRELQTRGRYTAKDVAALEVIVDLVRNPSSYEEQEAIQAFTDSSCQNQVTTTSPTAPAAPTNSSIGTNSIQVHIAIPYNLSVDKKRSVNPLRVRRVFAAKMFTPVDLEYQVQSFEASTEKRHNDDSAALKMGPKMYLLIDTNGSLARSNLKIQPLKGNVDFSNIKVRQADTPQVLTQKVETTSNGKNLAKVTLSKNFVAAVNRHLVQLYENLTSINKSAVNHRVRVRKTSHYEEPKTMDHVATEYRRHINWEAVKKYFGHDRVCNCKCKANKTMCRACAASDAVISELIFQFNSLSKYMSDHCTEIQTFFWMNPSGGKKLRDSVHRLDKSLHDYYKRVKGKCKGRTCNTFSTCIDKRCIVREKKRPKKYVGDPLIVDLQILADDIETASKQMVCLTENFMENGKAMVEAIGNCIRLERKAQTSTTAKKKVVKPLYSLDNINVNIICNPDYSSGTYGPIRMHPTSTVAIVESTSAYNYMQDRTFNIYDYGSEIKPSKKKGFLRSFAKRKFGKIKNYKLDKIFTYYVTKESDVTEPMGRMFRKRQTAEQIERPVILHNYLKRDLETTIPTASNEYPSKSHSMKHVFQRAVDSSEITSVDTLTQNINELFKILRNVTNLKDIESISRNYMTDKDVTSTVVTKSGENKENKTEKHTSAPPHKKTETTNILKTIKAKLHFNHKKNNTKNTEIPLPEPKPKTKPISNDLKDKKITEMTTSAQINSTIPINIITEDTTTTTTNTIKKPEKTNTATTKTATPTNASERKTTKSEVKSTPASLKTTTKSTSSKKDQGSTTSKKATKEGITEPKNKLSINISAVPGENHETAPEVVTKSNFLHKIKTGTITFLLNRIKNFHKGTTTETFEETRKSRSSSNQNWNNFMVDCKTVNTKSDMNELQHITISEGMTANPTILIINDYDTEMTPNLPDLYDDLNKANTENVNLLDKKPANNEEQNLRGLLPSILSFEKRKLDDEWRRYKESQSQLERSHKGGDYEKRYIFGFQSSARPITTHKSAGDADYDIIRTIGDQVSNAKILEHPEKKGGGLLHRIVSKFGLKVVSTAGTEKPRQSTVQTIRITQPTVATTTLVTTERSTKVTTKQKIPPFTGQPMRATTERPKKTTENPAATTTMTTGKKKRLNTKQMTTRRTVSPRVTTAEKTKVTKRKQKKISKTVAKKKGEKYTKTSEEKSTKNNGQKKLNPKYTTMSHLDSLLKSKRIDGAIEVVDSNALKHLCDVNKTLEHVHNIQKTISKKNFEKYVSNLRCFKYKNAPEVFYVKTSNIKKPHRKMSKKWKKITIAENTMKWDWIRNKRSLKLFKRFRKDSQRNKPYRSIDGDSTTKHMRNETNSTPNTKTTLKNRKGTKTDKKYKRLNSTVDYVRNTKNSAHCNIIGEEINDTLNKINRQDSLTRLRNDQTNILHDEAGIKDDTIPASFNDINFITDNEEYFESFVKDEFGIYRISRKRQKRTLNAGQQLTAVLRNLPFSSEQNETYAMLGDSVIIHCTPSPVSRNNETLVTWKTDRSQLLEQDNVGIEGAWVYIKEVEPKNAGVYTCLRGTSKNNVKLTLITLPTYKILVTLVYSLKHQCGYDDLKALQSLGPVMKRAYCPNDEHCSISVEEPICLEDRLDGSAYTRARASLSLRARSFPCSAHCRRDLHNALALIAAVDARSLASVGVVLSNGGVNKSLVPSWSARSKKAIVTHTLRRKDTVAEDPRYHVDITPGSVGLLALCPAGYYLLSGQKICVLCPAGSWAEDGDNACLSKREQIADHEQGHRVRRSQWWWYPGCGYCALWWALACACAAVVALAHSRRPRPAPAPARDDDPDDKGGERTRPLSPSRVILAKFFKSSRSCTGATDSQETKFELWKGQRSPPPLPPIDFDL